MDRDRKAKRTILVVEDYDDVRRMLKMLLESERLRVLEAASGPEALNVIKTDHPDVVLTDLALPGFDGFETIRRIRKIDGFQNTPIIVLSAHSGQSIYESAVRAGTDYFMAKPVDFDELVALLKEISEDGNGRNLKHDRSPAQRAMISNELSMRRPQMGEVRVTT